jgi:hypothetical protein
MRMVPSSFQAPTASMTVRCRQICAADFDRLAELLERAFPIRPRREWLRAFDRMTKHPTPEGFPKFGYVLEHDTGLVGVLLVIFAVMADGEHRHIRGNVASWYVEPQFRAYAPMLASQTTRFKTATVLNISPGQHTLPIIEALGFSRFSNGVFLAVAALNGGPAKAEITAIKPGQLPPPGIPAGDLKLLSDHAEFGCLSLWCQTPSNGFPFIFRARRILRNLIPTTQLVYCRDIASFVHLTGPIGRHLASRMMSPFVEIDAAGPIAGLKGRYFNGKIVKYYRGPVRPRLGDLAYTEAGMFGFASKV